MRITLKAGRKNKRTIQWVSWLDYPTLPLPIKDLHWTPIGWYRKHFDHLVATFTHTAAALGHFGWISPSSAGRLKLTKPPGPGTLERHGARPGPAMSPNQIPRENTPKPLEETSSASASRRQGERRAPMLRERRSVLGCAGGVWDGAGVVVSQRWHHKVLNEPCKV